MGEVKISALPSDGSPTTTDKVPVVDTETTTTKRITILDLITLIFNNIPAAGFLSGLAAAVYSAQNLLINGNFDVWQRNTTATPNDDVYSGADRWNFLAEANGSWTVALDSTNVPTAGSKYAMKCSNVTLNNQMAIVQILETRDSAALIGNNVSLSFQAKTVSSEISKLRCAILSWTGTEDVVTSDVIATWAQNGTNPTWATNWTMENTPADLTLTNSFQRFTIENVAIDTASAKNVAVVIWVDDGTIAAGDDFWISQVQLNVGSKAMQFQPRPYAEEFNMCQRYYEVLGRGIFGQVGSASTGKLLIQFRVPKRATPTIAVLNTGAAFEETWVAARTPSPLAITSASALTQGLTLNIQGFSGMTTGNRLHTEADSIFSVDSEL